MNLLGNLAEMYNQTIEMNGNKNQIFQWMENLNPKQACVLAFITSYRVCMVPQLLLIYVAL